MTELFIQKNKDNKQIAISENGKLIEYYEENKESKRREGNIYIGVVRNIIKGMQAAFVDIGTEKNSFIYVKDVLPKIDETKSEKIKLKDINEVVKNGQRLLVQVKKDSNDQKGARISTHINLPGKYIALKPESDVITISKKIENIKEKERLLKLVKENLSNGNGAIIRTSAEGKEKEIIEEIKTLENKWNNIKKKSENVEKPKLISESESIEEKIIIDLIEKDLGTIEINDKKELEKIKDIVSKETKIEFKENKEILSKYDLYKQIEKIKNRKVWLKSGGFITLDKTEALTAIDVNTGKFTGNNNLEETVFKVNKEATIEIAKQIRLRDIGGIIIIDYIDMHNQEHKEKIQSLLEEELRKDRAKTQIEGFTKLDLMEMTRKHICSHKEIERK